MPLGAKKKDNVSRKAYKKRKALADTGFSARALARGQPHEQVRAKARSHRAGQRFQTCSTPFLRLLICRCFALFVGFVMCNLF